MLVGTGVAQVVLTAVLMVNAFLPDPRVWVIYLLGALLSAAQSLQRPSREALVPRTVAPRPAAGRDRAVLARDAGRAAGRPGDRRRADQGRRRRLVLRDRRRRAGRGDRAVRPAAALSRAGPQQPAQPRRDPARACTTPSGARTCSAPTSSTSSRCCWRCRPCCSRPWPPTCCAHPRSTGCCYTAETVGSLLATATSGWTSRVHAPRPGRGGRRRGVGRRGRPGRPVPQHWMVAGLLHGRRRRRHGQRHLPLAPSGTRPSRTPCAGGWPASRCCPTPWARSAARRGPGWSPTAGACGPRSPVAACCACSASCVTSAWLRDFWSYDDRTDEHAVRERAVRAAQAAS